MAAFNNRQTAQNLANELDAVVGNTFVETASVSGDRVYRVRVGPFNVESRASRALSAVRGEGHRSARIFTEGVS